METGAEELAEAGSVMAEGAGSAQAAAAAVVEVAVEATAMATAMQTATANGAPPAGLRQNLEATLWPASTRAP